MKEIDIPELNKFYSVRECVDLGYTYGVLLNEIVNEVHDFGNGAICEPMFIHDRFLKKQDYLDTKSK